MVGNGRIHICLIQPKNKLLFLTCQIFLFTCFSNDGASSERKISVRRTSEEMCGRCVSSGRMRLIYMCVGALVVVFREQEPRVHFSVKI